MNRTLKIFAALTTATLVTAAPALAFETDKEIQESIGESYVFKTYLEDADITTTVKNGDVALTGTVNEASHKALAEETVANLDGVKSVDNQLELKGDLPEENSDGWISMQVKSSLLYNRHVSGINTQVFVEDGVVTLKGEAQNQGEKDLVGQYAGEVENVKSVKNEMTIAPTAQEDKQTWGEKVDDASITAQVKMALLFHRSTSAIKTGVETNEGIVTLTGETTSAAAKEMAAKVTRDVHGVTDVINSMTIKQTL